MIDLNKLGHCHIYYSNVKNLDINVYLDELPEVRRKKAILLGTDEAKKLSVGVFLLLKKALKLNGYDKDDFTFRYDEKGKPYIEDCPLQFSITHSGDYVAVAICNLIVGLDLQQKRHFGEAVLKHMCNDEDIAYYESKEDKEDAFFTMWAYKEAYLKMTGDGLTIPLKEVKLDYSEKTHGVSFYKSDDIAGYKLVCATLTNNFKKICEIKL